MSTDSKRLHLNHFLNKKTQLCEYNRSTVTTQLIITREGKENNKIS